MKMELTILFIACALCCATASPMPAPDQNSEPLVQKTRLSINQARTALSDARELLKQDAKIAAELKGQNEQNKKNAAAAKEHDRITDVVKKEIETLRNEINMLEKGLAAQTKQIERYTQLQAELEKAKKDSLDSETKAQQAEAKLLEAQKTLAELKNRSGELISRADDTKKQAIDLENATAALEKEKTRKAEALTRAENAVVQVEKAEKERLRLASRLAEVEQNQPPQQYDPAEKERIENEFRKEKRAVLELEAQVKKEENAAADAEKSIAELKKQIAARSKAAFSTQDKEDLARFQARLAKVQQERAEAQASLSQAEGKRQEAEKSTASLTDVLAGLKNNEAKNEVKSGSPEQAKINSEIENEKKILIETRGKIKDAERAREEAEQTITDLNKRIKAGEKSVGASSQKAEDMSRLQARLEGMRKQRAEAQASLSQAEGKRQEAEKSVASLTDVLAGLKNNEAKNEMKSGSPEQAKINSEIENEKKILIETRGKIKDAERAREEAEQTITDLNKRIKAGEKSAEVSVRKAEDMNQLQARLEGMRKQRVEAEDGLRQVTEKLSENEKAMATLTNVLADSKKREDSDREMTKSIATLNYELAKETALMNEATASLKKKDIELKTIEDEKGRLNERLLLVKAQSEAAGQNAEKLKETGLQLSEQKKLRASAEEQLLQAGQKQQTLAKEIDLLKAALLAAQDQVKRNADELKMAENVSVELRDEKILAGKSSALLMEKEEVVKQLAGEKAALQKELDDAEAKVAQQKEQSAAVAETRRALADEKKARQAAEKRAAELAKAEKEHQNRIKELKTKLRATAVKAAASPVPEDKTASLSPADESASRDSDRSDANEADVQSAAKDPLAAEQDILNKARGGSAQASVKGSGTVPLQEKRAGGKTDTGSRQNKIREAEDHYALGIQKWDEEDIDGAIAEFKQAVRLNPEAAGAYYNISLANLRQGKKEEACDYAYKAGECYLKMNNYSQATKMAVLIMKINPNSPLIAKLRSKIAAVTQ